jgi:hypothetical protein
LTPKRLFGKIVFGLSLFNLFDAVLSERLYSVNVFGICFSLHCVEINLFGRENFGVVQLVKVKLNYLVLVPE